MGHNGTIIMYNIGSNIRLMHQSFVSTAPPPTGKGGDNDFSLLRALLYAPPVGTS